MFKYNRFPKNPKFPTNLYGWCANFKTILNIIFIIIQKHKLNPGSVFGLQLL